MDNIYRIAAYIRLSSDDDDIDNTKFESESVSNQRSLIKKYIEVNAELRFSQYLEFIDDGYSGVNFNRPEFKEMIDSAKKGEIDCIIVKDLSRFGRSHIEVGYYLENIFPFLGIRFISINDNFDSKYSESIANIEIGFRNIMYEFYSVDLGRKVKTSMELMRKKGLYICTYPPYGYKRSENDKYKLEVDEESAKIVKRIFDMRISGMTYAQIAQTLNKENVPSPGVYLNMKINKRFKVAFWNSYSILHILKNEVYIGNMCYNKNDTIKTSTGNRIIKRNTVVNENTHEAIVDRDVFRTVNSYKKNKNKTYSNTYKQGLLSGKLMCKACGRKFVLIRKKYRYYFCQNHNSSENIKCYRKYTKEEDITRYIISEFNKAAGKNKIAREISNSVKRDEMNYKKIIGSTKAKIERLKLEKFDLFDKYASESNMLEEYSKKSTEIDEKIRILEKELTMYKDEYKKCSESNNNLFDEYKNIKNIDREMIDKLIDIIIVDSEGNLEIKWKF